VGVGVGVGVGVVIGRIEGSGTTCSYLALGRVESAGLARLL